MLIKYGNNDVTDRLLSYKLSVSFSDGCMIGNVPSAQLEVKFDNYDGILDNLDLDIIWETQENDSSKKRYFKIYDQPEKYTKELTLKMYDCNYQLDIAYDTKLSYPVTIKDQLDEIESLTGLSIKRDNIPSYVLKKSVAWYDNTIVIRNYLGWIAELFGANVFAETAAANGTSVGAEAWSALIANPTEAVIYGLIFVALTMLIVLGGVGGGIEKVCSVGMPALFVMLLICIVRACTLEGAVDGLKYMFVPGWAVANGVIEEAPNFLTVLSTAGGQMFFSLSLGMGAMITYGSYLDKKENLQKNALLIIIMDTLVALMAGLCVIPGRFALDPTGSLGGPKLLFVTMQNVFSRMGPIGPIFGILFYLLVVFAAISSSISLLEAVVAHFVDNARDAGKGDKRKAYALIAAVAVGVGAMLICADSLGEASFTPWRLLNLPAESIRTWNDCWLDFFDMLSEGIMMPLGALMMTLMVGWELGPDVVKDECEASGHAMASYGFYKVCIKYITPLCMILVLYGQIKEFFF
mgnify:CR=1 FL=1